MFNKTVTEISNIVEGTIIGDRNIRIKSLSGIKEAGTGDLTFLAQKKYLPFLNDTSASAILIDDSIECNTTKTLIRVKNASQAFNTLISNLYTYEEKFDGVVSDAAIIGEGVKLGNGVTVQPLAVIENNAEIGDNTVIQSGSFIAQKVKIGSNTRVYPNVSILQKVKIGNNVIIHSGTVVGSDGFGFEPGPNLPKKILQVGSIIIEDNVEIGANVTIDRARVDKTIIRHGTKIDNLVHIAHNVDIGENCLLLAQAGVAGSSILGKNVIIAGQAGVTGHLTIGDNVIVTSRGVVTKDIKNDRVISGFPACDHKKFKKVTVSLNRVPSLIKRVQELENEILKLKNNTEKQSEKSENNC